MKKIILTLSALAITIASTYAQAPAPAPQPPVSKTPPQTVTAPATPVVDKKAPDMVFESETIDYGTIDHFADGHREFVFKNKGKKPLIITDCHGSCGCTVPTWSKEPIKPGKKGVIGVQYATDRVGPFEKTITVTSNAKTPSKVIRIKGVVKAEPATKPVDPNAKPVENQDSHSGHSH